MNLTEAENRGIDQDIFTAIYNIQEFSPLFKTLGLRFTYLGEGIAGIRMFPAPIYSSHAGRVNGGIIATLADNVMGMACMTLGHVARSVEINMNYFAPVVEGKMLTGLAHVINAGKSLVVAEANLLDDEGKLVAKSRGTYIREKSSPLKEHALLLTKFAKTNIP